MCVHKQTGQRYAIKVIDKKKFNSGKEALMGEVRILQALKHPHIISIQDVFETDRYLYLILELYGMIIFFFLSSSPLLLLQVLADGCKGWRVAICLTALLRA